MGSRHLRNHEIRDARRPSRRRTCAAESVGNTGRARKQGILGNRHPATRPQPRRHDRLVVRRIPFRARRVGSAGNVRCGLCGRTPTDWTLYDTHYTERYLGLDPAVYERNSIIADAPQLDRPLMLIHGFADDNVTIAHSLRLSQALMAAGRKHTFLPLTGITHMTNDETVAENLLILQRDFLAEALGR